MRKALTLTSKILLNVFVILFALIMVGSSIAMDNYGAINSFLNVKTYEVIEDPDKDENEDLEYYKSEFNSVRETKDNSEKKSQEVVKEGCVLLMNDNNALPIEKGKTVSLFSISSVDLVYAGTGSSGTNTSTPVTLKEALEKSGLKVNTDLWNWYESNKSTYGRGSAGGTIGATFQIKDANWSQITTGAKTNKADAAIFVLARNGGEGADLTVSGGSASDMTDGNYLKLSPREADVLANLNTEKEKGTFGSIIVILNSANQVESKFLLDPQYGVDAALWIGDIGSTGIYGVGELLVGDAVPSGRLADTFWYEHYQNPALANFGAYSFKGSGVSSGKSNTYVAYQEGVYVGYRYTETRYEDFVMGTGNAGEFDYERVVAYPFGYGISYTEFTYSNFELKNPAVGKYSVSVTVRNSGSTYSGKEVVQVYLQKPYTAYDRSNGIEKPAVELVGFAKTKVLKPGETEKVTVDINVKDFASYDACGSQGYLIEAGTYYLAVGKDAHDAVNNILAAKGKKVSDGMTHAGDGKMTGTVVKTSAEAASDTERFFIGANGERITNKFDNADLNRYEGRGENTISYISRDDWSETVKLGYDASNKNLNNNVVINGTAQMATDIAKPKIEKDDVDYPTYNADQKYSLVDLSAKEIEYDNEMWDVLLDQMSWEETVVLLSMGLRMTYAVNSVNKPQTIDHNGATGPTQPYNDNAENNNGLAVKTEDPDGKEKPTVYPCNGLLASTYNVKLIDEFGNAMGNDCLWAGYSGLYGPGINIHRTPYGGRTFEYYSEDPVLSGTICAAEVAAIQKYGCNVYLKHCFLNDQETNREGICTWANEQSIREIYLKAFQIAIEQGGAMNVMTGFNRLGVVWTGHQGFCNTVLHDEFGMKGLAVSDWYQTGYMSLAGGVLNGNDLPDGSQAGNGNASASELNNYKTGYGKLAWAMRESAHRILYHAAHSNAMNGYSSGTKIVILTPTWVHVLTALKIVGGILFGLSAAFCIAMICLNKFKPEA